MDSCEPGNNISLYKTLEMSWLLERLLDFHKGICYPEAVFFYIIFVYVFLIRNERLVTFL